MTINLTITPYEYALACLGAAALGKTLEAAIVQAQVSVTMPAPGKEGCDLTSYHPVKCQVDY